MPAKINPNDTYMTGGMFAQYMIRWTTTDDATVAAYIAYLEKVGPSVVMVHSQGGLFG